MNIWNLGSELELCNIRISWRPCISYLQGIAGNYKPKEKENITLTLKNVPYNGKTFKFGSKLKLYNVNIKGKEIFDWLHTEDNNMQLEKDNVMIIPYKYVLFWENTCRKKQGRV